MIAAIIVQAREGRKKGYVPLCDFEVTARALGNFWPVRELDLGCEPLIAVCLDLSTESPYTPTTLISDQKTPRHLKTEAETWQKKKD